MIELNSHYNETHRKRLTVWGYTDSHLANLNVDVASSSNVLGNGRAVKTIAVYFNAMRCALGHVMRIQGDVSQDERQMKLDIPTSPLSISSDGVVLCVYDDG